MRVLVVLAVAIGCFAQSLDKPANFLVKLSDPIGSKISKPGSRVGAVVISPEIFLGGRFEGAVTKAGAGRVEVVFQVLKYKGKSWNVITKTKAFVNSIGHADVDEAERVLKLENGVLVSANADMMLDEGAELKLEVSPKTP
jgi:hypothetical protein